MLLNLFNILGDVCVSKKGLRQSVKILHRYHFTSVLKRMSVIASVQSANSSSSNHHIVATKGAPETLRKMVKYKICLKTVCN